MAGKNSNNNLQFCTVPKLIATHCASSSDPCKYETSDDVSPPWTDPPSRPGWPSGDDPATPPSALLIVWFPFLDPDGLFPYSDEPPMDWGPLPALVEPSPDIKCIPAPAPDTIPCWLWYECCERCGETCWLCCKYCGIGVLWFIMSCWCCCCCCCRYCCAGCIDGTGAACMAHFQLQLVKLRQLGKKPNCLHITIFSIVV